MKASSGWLGEEQGLETTEGTETEDTGTEDTDTPEGHCSSVVGTNVKVCGAEL